MTNWPQSPAKAATAGATPLVPADVRDLLGPRPVLAGEDASLYDKSLAQLAVAIDPQDFVEWVWVKDLTDILWDAARIRRAKTVRLGLARQSAIRRILEAGRVSSPLDSFTDHLEFLDRHVAGVLGDDELSLLELDAALGRLGLDRSAIEDTAFHASLDDMERLQSLLDKATARRDTILREIDRRRSNANARARVRETVDRLSATGDVEG